MKHLITSDKYCYIEDEIELNLNDKIYTSCSIELRFRLKEKLDKRTIFIYAISALTDEGKKILEEACDKSAKVPWKKMEKDGNYFDVEAVRFVKMPKDEQKFVFDYLTKIFEEIITG